MEKPTIKEVQAYITEKNLNIDAQAFWFHYDAKGWKTKSGPMVSWRSSIGLWGVQGWGKTGKSTSDHHRRSSKPNDHQKQRDMYEDHFRGKKRAALEDLRKDPGALKHVIWLMDEILAG